MASKNIKGITIEIDGNTQPLSNALSDINKKTRDVQKEINQVNKALELDPTNAEQVARKMELLEKQADLAEQKVERLKQAQEKMKADGVSESSEEYKKLATQLAHAEGEFRGIQATIKETGRAFDDISESSKLVQTYFDATGSSADDLVDTLGSKLVQALNAGNMQGGGYVKTFQAISKELTGTTKYAGEVREALAQINQGVSLDKIRQDLEAIGKTKVSDLGVEFESLSQKSAQFDKELKDINQSLKLDPSNIDIVAQKQTVLSQAIENSQTKLQQLNQRFSELKANNVDLNDEEFRNLQREIINTTNGLTGYQTELSDLQNAQQRLNTYFEATGTSVKDFANVLGSELVAKIERGEASSQELATALNMIGQSAISNSGDIDRFKATLDSVNGGVSFDRIKSELNQLGSEFNESETDVDDFKSKLESIADSTAVSAISDVADQVGELGDKLAGIGEGALDASSTVQDATAQIKVGLGETSEEAEKSLETVKSVFSQGYGQSIGEVSEKFVYLKQVLGDTVDPSQLEPLLKQFMSLEMGGMDFNETVRAVKNTMVSFGDESDRVMDLITVGMQHGLNYTDELGDNLAEYAARWGEAGTSLDDYLSILEAGTENGAYNLDKVGDYLNEFLTSLSDGRLEENMGSFSQSTQEVFEAYKSGGAKAEDVLNACIGDMKNMTSETDRAALASTIWSSLGEDNAMGLILSLGDVENKYGDVGGAAEQAAEDNSNSVQEMANKWALFQQEFAPIGAKLAEVGIKILEALKPVVDWLSDAFSKLSPDVQDFIVIFGGILAVVAPIAAAIGGLVTILGGPVLAVIVAVCAAVAAIIAIFKNWDTITQTVQEQWTVFCDCLSRDWNNFCSSLQDAWDSMIEWFNNVFSGIGSTIGQAWSDFTQTLSQTWNDLTTGLTDAWNSFWDTVKSVFDETGQWLSDSFNSVKDTLTGVWDSLCSTIGDLWNKAKDNISNIGNTLKDNLSDTWNNIKDNASKTWNSVKDNLTTTWNNLKDNAGQTWNNIKDTISDKAGNIKDNLAGKWNQIVNDFSNIWNNLKTKASQIWENVKQIVSNGVNSLKNLMNFHWELPKIKLPHFRISGNFSLNPPSIPTIGVDWYAKGGILTKPTIFGMNGNTLLGGGEAGKEAVLPLTDLYDRLDNSEIVELLKQILSNQNPNIQVVLDTGALVGQITPAVDSQLAVLKRRGDRQ